VSATVGGLSGDGVERPGQVVADAAQRRGPGGGDLETMLLGAARGARRLVGGGHAAAAGHVEVQLAGRAHDESAAGGNGDRLAGGIRRPRSFAG